MFAAAIYEKAEKENLDDVEGKTDSKKYWQKNK